MFLDASVRTLEKKRLLGGLLARVSAEGPLGVGVGWATVGPGSDCEVDGGDWEGEAACGASARAAACTLLASRFFSILRCRRDREGEESANPAIRPASMIATSVIFICGTVGPF